MIDRETATGRIRAAQAELLRQDASLLIVGLSTSMLYLSGFTDEPGERLFLLCIPSAGEALFVVPKLYEAQVRAVSGGVAALSWPDGEGPDSALREALGRLGTRGTVLVDDALRSSFLLDLQDALPGRRFERGGGALAALRMMKGPEEVALLARAGEAADAAYSDIIATRFEGATELALAARLEAAMMAAGADEPAFKTLVASGPNGALPHYRAGHRRIAHGDVVILDFGCRVGGYCSDISRTVVCGEPSHVAVRAHAAVRTAQESAIAAVRSGVRAGDVDHAARQCLEQAGWGESFIHRTGHGIGLDVHEPPYISEGSPTLLQSGMSFSVEPGVYVTDRFGVRIEDVVVVDSQGARTMTASTRDLIVVR